MLYKFKNGKRVRSLSDIDCPVCKKTFKPRASKDIYCSRDCYYKMKKIRGDKVIWTDEMKEKMSNKYTGSGNPMFGVKGEKNPLYGKKREDILGENHFNWKGGKYIYKNGYVYCSNCSNEIAEHRLVMEEHLGRKLNFDEIIHHKNGDKKDNRIENLEIVSRSKHMKIHLPEIRKWFGIFQINSIHGEDNLFDVDKNIEVAKKIYDTQGLNAWVVYKTGAYNKFLNS